VREALFASLGSLGAIDGARVLDLFAGTGALGIEALSRGAASAVFVDSDPQAVAAVRTNLETTGLVGTVVRADAVSFLETCDERFDLVLADPPYAFDGWDELLARLPAPLAALESGEAVDPGPGWEVLRQRRYGDTAITIARRL
jgi:16S rRNA (guanine966-N2)-methyltransferase